MRLLTYALNGDSFRLGVMKDEKVFIDPQIVYQEKLLSEGNEQAAVIAKTLLPESPIQFIKNGNIALAAVEEALVYSNQSNNNNGIFNLEDVVVGPPILNPKKIICVGLNYADHIKEMGRELPTHPVIFAKFDNTLMGPTEDFPLREELTEKLDYEGEFAFVISKRADRVAKKNALDYVFGYATANDITARDMQKRTIEWLQGKTLNKSLPLGPYLVTKDEVDNPHNLAITTYVNDEIKQQSNTSNLVFDVNRLIEFLSDFMVLEAGDIIVTGTPGGVGEAKGEFLKDGDIVKVEIEQIGSVVNKIVQV